MKLLTLEDYQKAGETLYQKAKVLVCCQRTG